MWRKLCVFLRRSRNVMVFSNCSRTKNFIPSPVSENVKNARRILPIGDGLRNLETSLDKKMKWLMYKVPEHLVVHYGIMLMYITVLMPMYILDRPLDSIHYFNNFIIFDVIYYIFYEKLNFTND